MRLQKRGPLSLPPSIDSTNNLFFLLLEFVKTRGQTELCKQDAGGLAENREKAGGYRRIIEAQQDYFNSKWLMTTALSNSSLALVTEPTRGLVASACQARP